MGKDLMEETNATLVWHFLVLLDYSIRSSKSFIVILSFYDRVN